MSEENKQLTDVEKKREENEKATKDAQQQAAEQLARDRQSGQRPVVVEVQESVKKQLVEKFGGAQEPNEPITQ